MLPIFLIRKKRGEKMAQKIILAGENGRMADI
jgi:hypothetical protein